LPNSSANAVFAVKLTASAQIKRMQFSRSIFRMSQYRRLMLSNR